MAKILQTHEELEEKLREQFELLKVLSNSYDSGNVIAAKSMATCIRVLLHDTETSHSLLGQLNQKNGKFFCTSFPQSSFNGKDVVRVGSFCGLAGLSVGQSQSYIPYLDEVPFNYQCRIPFDEYWNKIIFIDQKKNSFTRRDIVLAVANQDGGAHVDPEIDKKYKGLARENALGWKTSNDGINWKPLQGAELAAIRQIGHEILRTFLPSYPKKKMITPSNGFVVGGMSLLITKTKEMTEKIIAMNRTPKVGRNEKCPCKSGLKYKRCHGK